MKKGFVFIETLVVLVTAILGILSIYKAYVSLSTNIENRKYYDNISDLYKTNILRSLIDNTTLIEGEDYILINSDNCEEYMSSSCKEVIEKFNVSNIYINLTKLKNMIRSYDEELPNSLKEYLKVIEKDEYQRYIIVNYSVNNKNYYASLNI